MMHRGIDFLLGFMGFLILVRIFAPADFGVWVLMITIISIIDVAKIGFLQNGIIKFLMNQTELEAKKLQTSALILNTILTFALIFLLWVAAPYLEHWLNAPGLASIIRIHCYVLPVLILHTHNVILMQANFNFKAYFLAGIAKSFPFFLILLLFYISNAPLSLTTLAWCLNATFAIATMTSYLQVKGNLHIGLFWDRYWISKIFHFGKYVFGTNLVSVLSSALDKFFLGALLSPVEVALANTAGRASNLIEIPVNSIVSVAYPKATEAYEKNELTKVKDIYEKSVGMMLSFTIPLFIIIFLFADAIILLIAGKAYSDAGAFLRILSFFAIIKPFDRQAGVFLNAIGKPGADMLLVICHFTITILFSWAFIVWLGLIGAAYAMVMSMCIVLAAKLFLLHKFIPIEPMKPFTLAINNYPYFFKYIIKGFTRAES